MSIRHNDVRREEGAILVQTALMILVLVALSTYVIDYGIVWFSRVQAQNAADAGALAGAIARAFDDFDDPPAAGGPADLAATLVAQGHEVWNETPGTVVTWDCPAGVAGRCVRVDAHRDGTNGSTTLPTIFAPLLGIATQGVKAMAVARAIAANATNCMRPWAVADKWVEAVDPPTVAGQYDRWDSVGGDAVELEPHDSYNPPSEESAGTGYTLEVDLGTELVLKNGNPSNSEPLVPGWFLAVGLPDGEGGYATGAGGDDAYRDAIAHCVGQPVKIGDYLPVKTGAMIGPTIQGIEGGGPFSYEESLFGQDPDANWNDELQLIEGSCAPGCEFAPGASMSPRIVPLAVFDIDEWQFHNAANDWSHCPEALGGGMCIKVVNILGFFVDRVVDQDVIGYLVTQPGEFVPGAPTVGPGASFLQSIHLVR